MSKRCRLSFVAGAQVSVAALVLGALACSSPEDGMPIGGYGGSGASTAGTGSSMAGSGTSTAGTGTSTAGTGTSTAGTGTGVIPSGGSGNTAGTSSGGSGTAGSGTAGSGGTGGGASGGAAGSSGSGGGGATDCSKLKICDDFEGDAPGAGASPWKKMGTVDVVTDVHHSGTHAVHIKGAAGGAYNANINESKSFPAADSWGRAWVQIKATSTEHQMFIGINLSGDQGRLLNRLGSDTPQVNFQKGDKFYAAEDKITQGTWFCYEWHVTTSATSIYINGKKQSLKNGTNGDAPGITGGTSLLLGFQRFANGSSDGEVWYDDVAVGDTQIGCQ